MIKKHVTLKVHIESSVFQPHRRASCSACRGGEYHLRPMCGQELLIPHELLLSFLFLLVSHFPFLYFIFLLHFFQFSVLPVLSRTSPPKILLSMPVGGPSSSVLLSLSLPYFPALWI